MAHTVSPAGVARLSDRELLDFYLSLSPLLREETFVSTAQAAKITGVSIRTIQLWIESGAVRAIVIGRRYRVVLASLKAYLGDRLSRLNGESDPVYWK